jgi:hypothetical protein
MHAVSGDNATPSQYAVAIPISAAKNETLRKGGRVARK